MYYNITIKSNGSEYSLTSDNREVTQREMDLYFASFFGASEEFKSKIKKVEIRYPDVKSINEIEKNNTQNIQKNETQTPVNQFKNQTTFETAQQELVNVQPAVQQENITQITAQPTQITAEHFYQQTIPTQVATSQSPTYAPTQVPTQMPTQITIQPTQVPTQIPTQVQQSFQANSAEINNFLNDYISSSLEPTVPKNLMESFENIQPYASINELSLEQIEEEYEHQKEVLEIKFDNTQSFQHDTTQPNYTNIQEYNIQPKEIEIDITEPIFSQEPSHINYDFEETTFEPQSEAPVVQNDIDELLSLAHSKMNALDVNLNFASTPEIISQEQNTYQQNVPMYSFEETNQTKLQNIFAQEQQIIQKTQIFNADTLEEDDFEDEPAELDIKHEEELNLNNISISIQPSNNPINYQEVSTTQAPTIQQQAQQVQNSNMQNQQNLNSAYQQDFKLYLSQYKPTQTSDVFLICAFYIKNILKQENFTMKFINSKLFQATGTIADMGIVDDLLTKEYIRIIDSPDSKKYCITSDGEGYFVSRLSL